jgi:hypothetical protein
LVKHGQICYFFWAFCLDSGTQEEEEEEEDDEPGKQISL